MLQPHQVLSEFYPSSILSSIQFYLVPSKFYLKVYPVLSSSILHSQSVLHFTHGKHLKHLKHFKHSKHIKHSLHIKHLKRLKHIKHLKHTAASGLSGAAQARPSRRQRMLRRELPGAAWETGSRQPGAAGRPGAESNREQPGAAGSWEQPVAASSQEQLEAEQMPDRNHISRL